MNYDREKLGLIPDALKHKIDLTPSYPATWHNRRRDPGLKDQRIRFVDDTGHLNQTWHPKGLIRRFLTALLSGSSRS